MEGNAQPAEAGHAASTEVSGEAHPGVFPPFDSTFFPSQLLWLTITFVVLYLLVGRVVIPRIGGILRERADRIASDLNAAAALKKQSDEAIAGYEKALAEARSSAFAIAAKAQQEAKAEADARQAEVEAGLNARLAEAEARVASIKEKALADIGAIASEATEEVVAALIGQKPTAQEVSAAVAAAEGARNG